jgi:hypothetical protein
MPKFNDTQLAAMTDGVLSLRIQIGLGRVVVWQVNDAGIAFVIPWFLDPLPTPDRMRAREILWPGQSRPYVPTLCGVGMDQSELSWMGWAVNLTQGTGETAREFAERTFRVIDPVESSESE